MPSPAINARSVSKLYQIQSSQKQVMLREQIVKSVSKRVQSLTRSSNDTVQKPKKEPIWALKQVSFKINHGESVGIIGANGAGKTTLLKVLSRITAPTEGKIRLWGRVGTLLEVGTGFHSELTGRENIFLNGAILGMRKTEIERKFDEIVDFSGVEAFIDTPVKRYSTGMRMRLAFSVAAHLEPEIMLIDEVLAVGDIAFQKKSLDKMESVSLAGRTVLFVSHNLAAIKAFCPRTLYLEGGNLKFDGDTDTALKLYRDRIITSEKVPHAEKVNPRKPAQILSIISCAPDGTPVGTFAHNQSLNFRVRMALNRPAYKTYVVLRLYNSDFETILATRDFELSGDFMLPEEKGIYEFQVDFPKNLLTPGSYYVGGGVHGMSRSNKPRVFHKVDHAAEIEIFDNGSILAQNNIPWEGPVHTDVKWIRIDKEPSNG